MTTRLPLALEEIRIATPCGADWDDMAGDGRVRFCGRCAKNVYDLSAMTRAQAEALVSEQEGRLCVRLYRRTDGTVLTSDCPVGERRKRLRARMWASVASAAASVALVLGLLSGRARADLTVSDGRGGKTIQPKPHGQLMGAAVPRPPERLMGKLAPQPEPKVQKPKPLMGEVMMGDVAATK
jgi:hypothetical protein